MTSAGASGASAETVVVAPTLSTKMMKTLPVATEEATETLRGSVHTMPKAAEGTTKNPFRTPVGSAHADFGEVAPESKSFLGTSPVADKSSAEAPTGTLPKASSSEPPAASGSKSAPEPPEALGAPSLRMPASGSGSPSPVWEFEGTAGNFFNFADDCQDYIERMYQEFQKGSGQARVTVRSGGHKISVDFQRMTQMMLQEGRARGRVRKIRRRDG